MRHHTSSVLLPADAKAARAIAQAAERIGTCEHLTQTDWKLVDVAERTALHHGNRAAVRRLVSGDEPGKPWRQVANGPTTQRVAGAELWAPSGMVRSFTLGAFTMFIPVACLWVSRYVLGLFTPLAGNVSANVVG